MDFVRADNNQLLAGQTPVLLRGFGLGGWFLPEGYMWKLYTKCDRPRRMEEMLLALCGDQYAERFWERYYDSYITEEDIELIAKEGYNSVRLPLNARHLYTMDNGAVKMVPAMLERIDRLIEWCKSRDIYVILDMHGAPGGQTGQNIDDSEDDTPKLFIEEQYRLELIELWRQLALRYAEEPAVTGYDLLNEPLPNFFSQYNDGILPLYRRLIKAIREVDKKHLIILEGAHWATDFSIFEPFTPQEAEDNIMLQFHKYWSPPEQESLMEFIRHGERLNTPLFMGEGGENNLAWYTTIFPLYERLGISWSFWSYKKMDSKNSPVTFSVPEGWNKLIDWLDYNTPLGREEAIAIFDAFIQSISTPILNREVFCALNRQPPVTIPCEAFDACKISSIRKPGADLRLSEPVTLLFKNGKTGVPDYKRYGGEPEPEEENVIVLLERDDTLYYRFSMKNDGSLCATFRGEGQGTLLVRCHQQEHTALVDGQGEYQVTLGLLPKGEHKLELCCRDGSLRLDTISLRT